MGETGQTACTPPVTDPNSVQTLIQTLIEEQPQLCARHMAIPGNQSGCPKRATWCKLPSKCYIKGSCWMRQRRPAKRPGFGPSRCMPRGFPDTKPRPPASRHAKPPGYISYLKK